MENTVNELQKEIQMREAIRDLNKRGDLPCSYRVVDVEF